MMLSRTNKSENVFFSDKTPFFDFFHHNIQNAFAFLLLWWYNLYSFVIGILKKQLLIKEEKNYEQQGKAYITFHADRTARNHFSFLL